MISAINFNEAVEVYTEAVFTNGKAILKPIVDQFQVIKDLLESQIKDHRETAKDAGNAVAKAKIGEITGKVTIKAFNPEAFWRNTEWKKLEDIIQKMFGLRVCKINPYNEKYNMGKDEFESKELNAYVYRRTRYPVEGLITEKGFFDKSHSLDLDMYISLGLLRYLTASEIVAVMLHEFGHSIDPALCDIKYTGTNILCKYITDRKGAINKEEQRLISDRNKVTNESKGLIILPFFSMIGSKIKNGIKNLFSAIKGWFTKKEKKDENITEGVLDIFQSSSKRQDIKLKKLQKIIEQDMIEFNRKEYSEAFADNFARMYGFGAEMASALKKLSKDVDTKISRIDKERRREDIIYNIAESAIKDVHKTDVHRIKALIKEYQDDIKDPNTPAEVKKQLEADVKEVELVLDQFMNDFSEFQNRINKLISEELDKMNITDDEVKKESVITESHTKPNKSVHATKEYLAARRHKDLQDSGNKQSFRIDTSILERDRSKLEQAAKIIYEKTKIPSIVLTSTSQVKTEDITIDKLTATKFGGYPYWPKDMKWPEYNGKPLICVAQLNFSELPHLADFPSKGIMQFFISTDEVWDVDDDQSQVIYHDNIITDISKLYQDPKEFPRTTMVFDIGAIEGVTYLKGNLRDCGITIVDDKMDDLAKEALKQVSIEGIDDNMIWMLEQVYSEEYDDYAGHRIGGHPYFTQTDIREGAQHDVMLLQIDTDGLIMWGDCGIAHFFTSANALKSLQFKNKVLFTWDCC